jgi:putative DNA primase/helicase
MAKKLTDDELDDDELSDDELSALEREWELPDDDDEPVLDDAPASNGQVDPPVNGHPDDLRLPQNRTDVANAGRLAVLHGDDLRWCDPWNKWLGWDGRRWAQDAERCVDAMAKDVAATVWEQTGTLLPDVDYATAKELTAFARMTASSKGIGALLSLTRSEPGIPILPDKLDSAPWLLNVANGTVDLRSGKLRPHDRADMLTKLCPLEYDAGAECPHWLAMLETVMGGHADLITFLQRAVGYSLTGNVSEQILLLLWGTGSNGKSTLLNALLETLGSDYAMQAPAALLMAKRGEHHPTELCDLHGKRLVVANETEDGARLAESLVKQLTGGESIRARRMREDHWQFSPTHKIWLAGNHKPQIRGTDHAIWRRVKLVPFTVTIPDADQDKALPDKLRAERAGILAWAVRGCQEWRQHGLGEPEAVRAATQSYRDEQDVLGAFILEATLEASACRVRASELYAAYVGWCQRTGEHAVTQRRFGQGMTERGFQRYTNNGPWYRGVGLIEARTDGTDGTDPDS